MIVAGVPLYVIPVGSAIPLFANLIYVAVVPIAVGTAIALLTRRTPVPLNSKDVGTDI